MNLYVIPENYYFRIHHVRPRFKSDIENVLFYVAKKITAIGEQPKENFVEALNKALFQYPGNAHRTPKTINNWRTEISSLFGFIEHKEYSERPGQRAVELSDSDDLVQCFKTFLYNFQYPGAHIKPAAVLEQIKYGIKFKPAQYILKVLREANTNSKNTIGLTKAEVCHCIFNDLRVTRDGRSPKNTWQLIFANRQNDLQYDTSGDVIRYAGDIIDYMEIANLIKTYDGNMYYLNSLEEEAIIKFVESKEWFSEYDHMIARKNGDLDDIKNCSNKWFEYVNRDMHKTDFSTDILSFISPENENERKQWIETFKRRIGDSFENFSTKDIGDIGEGLIHEHECMRIKIAGREDLIHLIKRIPTSFAVGYDISSVETDERKRYIEVKTTISAKPLHFNSIHLTKNEWNTADSVKDRYFVYRLMLSKHEHKLLLIQDPVGLYKKDMIRAVPSNGMEISFDPSKIGVFEELLTWEKSE